jgi:hypothetical protein
VGTSETLRSVIDAGRNGKRLDELTTARVIGKAAERLHAAQQLAGPGKAVGPITPIAIAISTEGTVTLELDKRGSALAYSAPEVAAGSAGDRRSDVFSLGCVMWEALTHQRLFDAMNEAAVKAALTEREIKAPSEINANIPAELSAMCMKALSRSPADRYASAKVMGVEIEEFLEEAGYEDSNAKVAQFLTAMKQKPMPSLVKPAEEKKPEEKKPEPKAAAPEPSTLTSPPASAGAALAQKLSAAETKPVPAPPILPAAAKPAAQIVDNEPAAAPSALASSLPPLESVAAFAPPPAAPTPAPAAPTPAPAASTELPRVVGKQTIAAVVPPMVSASATISSAVPPMVSATATIPDGAPAIKEPPVVAEPPKAKAKPEPAAPEKSSAEGSAPHAANPIDAVSLPRRSHRDSEQMLNKWAWQTDTNEAIDDEDFHKPPSRRPLYYAIGAGCVVALIVSGIALFGGGGSKDDKKPAQTAAKQTTAEQPPAPAPAPAPEPAAAPPTGSAEAQPAPEPPKEETPPPPEPAKQEPPPPEPPKAAKAEPPPPPPKAEPPPPPPPKAEPPKVAKADPPKATKTVPKADPPKAAAKSAPLPPKADPPKAEPAKAAPKGDVEASYKQGLMQFARGDTQGALASLRTSLAANPNYAPTWRGLGLVFEKLGEKDQARAAFKRYLQLAPSASDTEQIKSRMERLGS